MLAKLIGTDDGEVAIVDVPDPPPGIIMYEEKVFSSGVRIAGYQRDYLLYAEAIVFDATPKPAIES